MVYPIVITWNWQCFMCRLSQPSTVEPPHCKFNPEPDDEFHGLIEIGPGLGGWLQKAPTWMGGTCSPGTWDYSCYIDLYWCHDHVKIIFKVERSYRYNKNNFQTDTFLEQVFMHFHATNIIQISWSLWLYPQVANENANGAHVSVETGLNFEMHTPWQFTLTSA